MPEFLFNDPHIEVTPDGDVLPDPGLVMPMNPYRAKGELISDHPQFTEEGLSVAGIVGQQSAKDAVMAQVDSNRGKKFSILGIPAPPETGSWGEAARAVAKDRF